MIINIKTYFCFTLSFLLLISCAKKPEFDSVYKAPEQTLRSNDYDTDSKYIFHATNLQGKRNVGHKIMPFHKGQGQVVKLRFEKEGLVVYTEEKDEKFKSKINETPIFTIPGVYQAYRCALNSLGECTNREEENTEIKWDKRPYFTPDFGKINMASSFDPVEFAVQDPCLMSLKNKVIHTEIKKGLLNFEIEREFAVNKSQRCLAEFNPKNLTDLSFKFRFFYSLVRMNDVVDPNYEKRYYPKEDQRVYGFFVTEKKRLDDDFLKTVKTSYMNRWSNNKKKLVYYLSDSFNEKNTDGSLKYEMEKKATYESVAAINKTFDEIDMPFRIEVREPKGIKAGDLRYSMINLVTDSSKHSTLGYGPSIKNPETGEIIHGLINMYYGTFRTMVPQIYRHMVEVSTKILRPDVFSFNKKKVKKRLPATESGPKVSPKEFSKKTWQSSLRENNTGFKNSVSRLKLGSRNFEKNIDPMIEKDLDFWNSNSSKDFPKNEQIVDKRKIILESLTKNNAYPMDYFSVKFNGKGLIPGIENIAGIKNEDGTLKTWQELEKLEKGKKLKNARDKIRKLILPYAWRRTFIHEMGHNLGLRHNFKGSYDRENYGDKMKGEEVKVENSFSSIMDYGHSQLNTLPNFGVYDKAALNMAYNNKLRMYRYKRKPNRFSEGLKEYKNLNLKKGKRLNSFKAKDKESGKTFRIDRFAFCTDHHVGSDPSCNRFDEGGSYVEIVEHYIEKYKSEFNVINFRNGRNSFNIMRLPRYFWHRNREFSKIREIYEALEEMIVKNLSDNGLKSAPFIEKHQSFQVLVKKCKRDIKNKYCMRFNDLMQATILAGKFFLNILKTPPLSCLVSNFGEDKEKAVVYKLRDIYYSENLINAPKSCFDKRVLKYFEKEGKTVLGERGRYIYSLEENDHNGYSTDINVIGVWIDKLLAMKYLVGRRINSRASNDEDWCFTEIPGINVLIDDFLMSFIQDLPIPDDEKFKDFRGKKIYFPKRPYKLDDSIHGEIPRQFFRQLIWGLRLPLLNAVSLNKKLIDTLNDYSLLMLENPKDEHVEYLKRFNVKKIADHEVFSDEFYDKSAHIENYVYMAKKENLVAFTMLNNINIWNKVFKNKKFKSFNEINEFKDIYSFRGNPFFSDEERTYVKNSVLKAKILDLMEGFGEYGKKFLELPNETKLVIYGKIEELRGETGEAVLDESLKKYEKLLKHFKGLDKTKWVGFSRKLANYNAYILGSKLLSEYLLRNRYEDEPEKLKLLFNESGKHPYRPIQMYQIGIALKRHEVKKIINELENSSWMPSTFNVKNKELLEMSWDELKDVDRIISVDSRDAYEKILKKLIPY